MSAIPQSRQAISTALYRDIVLFRPPYIGIPPYSGRLISVYHLTQTSLYRDTVSLRPPYWGVPTASAIYRYTPLLRPPYIGIPSHSDRHISDSDRHISVYRLTRAAFYRDTALLGDPRTPSRSNGISMLLACVPRAFSVVRTHKLPKQPGLFCATLSGNIGNLCTLTLKLNGAYMSGQGGLAYAAIVVCLDFSLLLKPLERVNAFRCRNPCFAERSVERSSHM